MRVVTTVVCLTAIILLWRNYEHEFVRTILYLIDELFRPIYNKVSQCVSSGGTQTDGS